MIMNIVAILIVIWTILGAVCMALEIFYKDDEDEHGVAYYIGCYLCSILTIILAINTLLG